MQFARASILLTLAAAASAATIAQVKQDVATINTDVTALKTALASNSLNYFSALAIHQQAVTLDGAVKNATADANSLTVAVSSSDASSLITTLTGTEKNVSAVCDRLVALKSQFTSLGVAGIAKGDIASLSTDVNTFGQALVSKTPSAQKATASALAAKFNADLARAAAAYA